MDSEELINSFQIKKNKARAYLLGYSFFYRFVFDTFNTVVFFLF